MNIKIFFFVFILDYVSSTFNDTYYGFLRDLYQPIEDIPCGNNDCGEPLYLTPLIEANRLQEARAAAYVTPDMVPGIETYTGYYTVNKKYNSNLYITYIPAINKNLKNPPLLIASRGGPGAPSSFDIFVTIGAFEITSDGKVKERKNSWNRDHAMIYISSPVGTGYSFTENDKGYSTNAAMAGRDMYVALQQVFRLFPELSSLDAYVIGQSYGSRHMLALGNEIHKNRCTDGFIKLKGFLFGSPVISMVDQLYSEDFALNLGVITKKNSSDMENYKEASAKALKQGNNDLAFSLLDQSGLILHQAARLANYQNVYKTDLPDFIPTQRFVQRSDIRKQIHAGSITFSNIEKKTYYKLKSDFMTNSRGVLEKLLNKYVFLLLDGDLSLFVSSHKSRLLYRTLNFRYANQYRNSPTFYLMDRGVVAGHYERSRNLITLRILRGGNSPSSDLPRLTCDIITRFFANNTIQ